MTNRSHFCGTGMFEVGMGVAASSPWHLLLTVTGMRTWAHSLAVPVRFLMPTLLLVLEICWNGEKVQEQLIEFGRLWKCCTGKKTNCIFHFFLFPSSLFTHYNYIGLHNGIPSAVEIGRCRACHQFLSEHQPRGPNPQWVWKSRSLCLCTCFIHSNSAESQALFKEVSLELKQ